MATFKAKIVSASGEREETLEAQDERSLYNELKAKGETLVSVDPAAPEKKNSFFSGSFLGRVSLRDKIVVAKNLSAMLDAGLSLSRALTVIQKQTRKGRLKAVIGELNKSIGKGKALHDAMSAFPEVFPPLMISMVRAGEESGSLSQSLRVVGGQMENSYKLTKKIRGAMMYPAVILVAMIAIGFFMLTFVVPTLSATFRELNADLPLITKIVIAVSDFLAANIIAAIIVIIGLAVFLYFGAKTKRGKRIIDSVLLHIPVIGTMVKEVNSARTARTFSSLLTAGVDIVVSIRITSDVIQNSYYKEVLTKVEERIQKGEPIAQVFDERSNLYPAFVAEMISVGEETGELDQMLMNVAVFYENEIEQKTKDMSSIIEPFLMVFIGLVVGLFAVAMISPIYSLSNNI